MSSNYVPESHQISTNTYLMGEGINGVLSGPKASFCHDKLNQMDPTCILKLYLSLLGGDVAVKGVNWSVL